MKIFHRQQVGFSFGQPLGANGGLALGTMAIAARAKKGDLMSALIALLEVATQSGSPAITNISQCFLLRG
jgi:hypothetical protein